MDPLLVYAAITGWSTVFILVTLVWMHGDMRKTNKLLEAALKDQEIARRAADLVSSRAR